MVDIFIATSINSKIYDDDNPLIFNELSTSKLMEFRDEIRNDYQTIIVGANTIKKDNSSLLNKKEDNIRIIVDKYADLNINRKIFIRRPERTYLILLKHNYEYEKQLINMGVNVIILLDATEEDIILKIKEISIGKILVEGGAKTINMFFKNKVIDCIKIVQFPIILSSLSLGFDKYINNKINLSLNESKIIDEKYIYHCYKIKE